jgi:hypothetical protein
MVDIFLRFQAGVQWGEAYLFAEKNNITLVGGAPFNLIYFSLADLEH